MKGNLTISRVNASDKEFIRLTINEENSRVTVIEVSVGLEEFTKTLTGLSEVSVELTKVMSKEQVSRLGKKREIKVLLVSKPTTYDQQECKQFVIDQVDLLELDDEWSIFDDGTRSQQNGSKHRVVMVRWV